MGDSLSSAECRCEMGCLAPSGVVLGFRHSFCPVAGPFLIQIAGGCVKSPIPDSRLESVCARELKSVQLRGGVSAPERRLSGEGLLARRRPAAR